MTTEAPEVIEVEDTRVACDGGGGALGHPKIYLEMGAEGFVECPLLWPPVYPEGRAKNPGLAPIERADQRAIISI